jgi:ATP-dependent RNA helicase RhlE
LDSTNPTQTPSRRRSGPRRPGRPAPGRTRQFQSRPSLSFEPAAHDLAPVSFADLPIDDRLKTGVADRGFERTTPIQSAVFPTVLGGGDLIACAQTGTGKTAAFLLPIMHRLLHQPRPAGEPARTRVLVLAPTRELAVQIEDDFQGFAYHTPLTGVAVYGGVGADPQSRALRAGVDVVIATPGRLQDHLNCGVADLGAVEVLVLDEADRMLDMGFWPDVRRIVSSLPAERQTLLFSATMSDEVVSLASQIMQAPAFVQVGPAGGPATTITHLAHVLPQQEKVDWLAGFLRRMDGPALVFVRTKRGADRLSSKLAARGIRCAALHADRTQEQRTAAIEGFRGGRFKVLVATDIAARGLDIDGIGHVINFEVPATHDTYVHRVGRTGRAEATGTALTLAGHDEVDALASLGKSIDLQTLTA